MSLKSKIESQTVTNSRFKSEIDASRMKLRAAVDTWRKDQALYMPDIIKHTSEAQNVEDEILLLPSELKPSQREFHWFDTLAQFEREIRKGQATDALSNLRLSLRYKDSLRKERKQIAYGNRNRTRASVLLERVAVLIDKRADTYRRARDALLALGMSVDDTEFPHLAPEHVTLTLTYSPKELGSGTYTGSWIWEEGPRGVLSDEEEDKWEEEGTPMSFLFEAKLICSPGNKVEWFRAKIDLQQWKEELEILDEELKRTARWFATMSKIWREKAMESRQGSGFSEYAYHKSDMFSRRSKEAVDKRKLALETIVA